ncbi:FxsA family membrane protein [Streptomyces violaceus]|uniref:FxsA family membrane protein n=1 Tax=Streptomyces violaceus TaxID=1936 RepID=A0ABY9UHG4_STRVL|nr:MULTISPECIES: FxsA family membrane protein [Streptomyces]MCT9139002.1 FxsA family protein [Streptomyces violarus]WND22319.1 FxsA family membrane protein [Streptomyces janthinus]WNF61082.1 FxsA family membrane protein [Streptomyces sp. CGMCC 4.1456]GGS67588.1 membrane protein [Streptomyces janthinus]
MTTGAQTPSTPARPRRSRLRTFLPLGLAAWLVLEIWLLTVVAGASSGLVVFLVLLAGLVLGSVVIKRAGRRAFRNLSEALQQQQSGAMPEAARPNSEGNGLMMLGGLLLMIPGLVSDAVGLLLLLPPVQKAVSRSAERTFERKLREADPGTLGGAFQQARMHRPDGKVVQGEVIRDEPGDAPKEPRPPLTH